MTRFGEHTEKLELWTLLEEIQNGRDVLENSMENS